MNQDEVCPAHLLVGLIREEKGVAGKLLRDQGVSLRAARDLIQRTAEGKRSDAREEGFVEDVLLRQIRIDAQVIQFAHKHKFLSTAHLLWAVLNMNDVVVSAVLNALEVNVDYLREEILTHGEEPEPRKLIDQDSFMKRQSAAMQLIKRQIEELPENLQDKAGPIWEDLREGVKKHLVEARRATLTKGPEAHETAQDAQSDFLQGLDEAMEEAKTRLRQIGIQPWDQDPLEELFKEGGEKTNE